VLANLNRRITLKVNIYNEKTSRGRAVTFSVTEAKSVVDAVKAYSELEKALILPVKKNKKKEEVKN
jgi:ABC-type polysaccharide/polyol phosphate transport system ATPase subunit